jgi:hypothetical protein
MRRLLGSVLGIAAMIAAAAPAHASGARGACRFTQRDFVGNWAERVAPGEAAYDGQEVQFDVEAGRRIFRSWLHQRPDMTGTWTFRNCQVTVRGPDNLAMTYRFVGSDRNRLIELDSGVTYKRLR